MTNTDKAELEKLREWPASVLVYTADPSKADAIVEHRERELGQRVIVLDPAARSVAGGRYNPLVECGTDAAHEYQHDGAAYMLSDALLNHGDERTQSQYMIHNLLHAVLLYVAHTTHARTGKTGTLSRVNAIFRGANDDDEIRKRLRRMHGHLINREYLTADQLAHVEERRFARNTIGEMSGAGTNPDATPAMRQSAVRAILACTEPFTHPMVRRATAVADWRVDDLVAQRFPLFVSTSVVLVARERHVDALRPCMRLLIPHIMHTAVRSKFLAKRVSKPRLLVHIDNFDSLGRMKWFERLSDRMADRHIVVRCNGNDLEANDRRSAEDRQPRPGLGITWA